VAARHHRTRRALEIDGFYEQPDRVPRGTLTPHPYALILPVLTDEEYEALKSDIRERRGRSMKAHLMNHDQPAEMRQLPSLAA